MSLGSDLVHTYIRALLKVRRAARPTVLNAWLPSVKRLWVPPRCYSHMAGLIPTTQALPPMTSKWVDKQKPKFTNYLPRQTDDGNGTKADYDQAASLSTEQYLQIQGFPSNWPIAATGVRCRSDPICRVSRVTKRALQVGGAQNSSVVQALVSCITQALKANHGTPVLAPEAFAVKWSTTALSGPTPPGDERLGHQLNRGEAKAWTKKQHWVDIKCGPNSDCDCCRRRCWACRNAKIDDYRQGRQAGQLPYRPPYGASTAYDQATINSGQARYEKVDQLTLLPHVLASGATIQRKQGQMGIAEGALMYSGDHASFLYWSNRDSEK